SLLASGRLDNLLSCWALTDALAEATPAPGRIAVMVLNDHEEVGSASATGAAGPLLERALTRLTAAHATGDTNVPTALADALAGSMCVSADNAHALHPNYPDRHERSHAPLVNHGPAVKVNVNQRYATTATSARRFTAACEAAGVPWQVFSSRNDVPCGSTIGPITATRLGVDTVDVGVPQLSMHSARELCGVDDPVYLRAAMAAYWSGSGT
ncbi:MAG: M18 family aminopeptidase, partial [Ilumatobacteraceae bacterium]